MKLADRNNAPSRGASLFEGDSRVLGSVSPAAGVRLRRFEIALRLFRQELRNHAHGEFDGDLATAAFLELLAQPAIDLFVPGLEPDGDLFQHLHQRFCCHGAPPFHEPNGLWLRPLDRRSWYGSSPDS